MRYIPIEEQPKATLGPGYKIKKITGPFLLEPESYTYSRSSERNLIFASSSLVLLVLIILIIKESEEEKK